MKRLTLAIIIVSLFASCLPLEYSTPPAREALANRLLIFGASGRIGGHIVDEALIRGYRITAVSRDATRLTDLADRVEVTTADILDRKRLAELVSQHDAIIVAVGGKPVDSNPENYIVPRAAGSLIDVLESGNSASVRLLFVGNVYTLIFEDNKTLLELGRVAESHPNYAMFHGHQLALDMFRRSRDVDWTVASPPNGLRLNGRTGDVRWGGEQLLRDEDGTPSTISPEDFAFAVLEELQRGNYIRRQFNAAR